MSAFDRYEPIVANPYVPTMPLRANESHPDGISAHGTNETPQRHYRGLRKAHSVSDEKAWERAERVYARVRGDSDPAAVAFAADYERAVEEGDLSWVAPYLGGGGRSKG